MVKQVQVLAEQTEAVVIGTDETIDGIFTRSATVLGVIALVIILAGITCGTLLYKTIMTPIQKLHKRVRRFGDDRAENFASSIFPNTKESTQQATDVMTDLNTSFNSYIGLTLFKPAINRGKLFILFCRRSGKKFECSHPT